MSFILLRHPSIVPSQGGGGGGGEYSILSTPNPTLADLSGSATSDITAQELWKLSGSEYTYVATQAGSGAQTFTGLVAGTYATRTVFSDGYSALSWPVERGGWRDTLPTPTAGNTFGAGDLAALQTAINGWSGGGNVAYITDAGGDIAHTSNNTMISIPSGSSGTTGNPNVIIAIPGESPTFTGTWDMTDAGLASVTSQLAFRISADYIYIADLAMNNFGRYCIDIDGAFNLIEGNTSLFCGDNAIALSDPSGPDGSLDGNVIQYNYIAYSNNTGIFLWYDDTGGDTHTCDDIIKRRNIVYRCGWLGQKVTNGKFDADTNWTKGTGWTISGGTASCDGSQVSTSNLSQTFSALTDSQYHHVRFTVSNYSAGTLTPILGGVSGSAVSANGEYLQDITSGSSNNDLVFQASADFVGDIDAVYCFELSNNAGNADGIGAAKGLHEAHDPDASNSLNGAGGRLNQARGYIAHENVLIGNGDDGMDVGTGLGSYMTSNLIGGNGPQGNLGIKFFAENGQYEPSTLLGNMIVNNDPAITAARSPRAFEPRAHDGSQPGRPANGHDMVGNAGLRCRTSNFFAMSFLTGDDTKTLANNGSWGDNGNNDSIQAGSTFTYTTNWFQSILSQNAGQADINDQDYTLIDEELTGSTPREIVYNKTCEFISHAMAAEDGSVYNNGTKLAAFYRTAADDDESSPRNPDDYTTCPWFAVGKSTPVPDRWLPFRKHHAPKCESA